MEETLILFETAKLAKKKGFVPPSGSNFYRETGFVLLLSNFEPSEVSTYIPFCSQSLLQKWLRETYNCMVWVEPFYYDGWHFKCQVSLSNGKYLEILPTEDTNDWQFILEEGLLEALKLI